MKKGNGDVTCRAYGLGWILGQDQTVMPAAFQARQEAHLKLGDIFEDPGVTRIGHGKSGKGRRRGYILVVISP